MDMIDGARSVDVARSRCFDLAAAAFSSNQLDLETYEMLAGRIAAAGDLTVLQGIESALPPIPQSPQPQAQLVSADLSKVKKTGRWVEASRIAVRGRMSQITLDFTAYAGERDLRLDLDLELKGSKLRIIVPENIDVVERLTSTRMSVFHDKRRRTSTNNAIVVSGSLSASNAKIKRKRMRHLEDRSARIDEPRAPDSYSR